MLQNEKTVILQFPQHSTDAFNHQTNKFCGTKNANYFGKVATCCNKEIRQSHLLA